MESAGIVSVLGLGFLLGLSHAMDADHVAAVTTIVGKTKKLGSSAFAGFLWGLGHTVMLMIVGFFLLIFKWQIPAFLADFFEFIVAVMLVALGGRVLWKLRHQKYHLHTHEHDGTRHTHFHSHSQGVTHEHKHLPFWVGMVHGLAGSAALMLLILGTIHSPMAALLYIVIFGIGSILGMLLISGILSLPFLLTSGSARLQKTLEFSAGLFSLWIGLSLAYEIVL